MTRFFFRSLLPPLLCESGIFGSLNMLSLLLFCVRAPGKKYMSRTPMYRDGLSLIKFHSFGRKIINKITHENKKKTTTTNRSSGWIGDIPSKLLKLILLFQSSSERVILVILSPIKVILLLISLLRIDFENKINNGDK